MAIADWTVLIAYLLGTVLLGVLLGKLVKSSSDMFSAGGTSPWWASGLSAFMTMFSANTFVVWGSIAFDVGLVAVTINLMYGVAALLVGYFVASHWKGMGIQTPAQYIQLRFGTGALHFYTWAMMVLRVVGTAAALYALAKILVALMPLDEGNPLRDPVTGNLSLRYAILIFGSI
ncbi:MAG: sodium:solute symporter family transporter, partial [Lentimonas sp.]